MDLVIATTNRGKFLEIEAGLIGLPLRLKFFGDLKSLAPLVEDRPTFEGNAVKKALTVLEATGLPTLADDSGLVVPALAGRPGIFSARYAGEKATDEENRQKLLEEMKGLKGDERAASFICVLALALPGRKPLMVEGRCDGLMTETPRGSSGFGYDPIFLVPELGKTMAELPLDLKNRISHRGRALASLREEITKLA